MSARLSSTALPLLLLLPVLALAPSSPTRAEVEGDLASAQAELGITLYLQQRYEPARDLLAGARALRPDDARIARYALFADHHAGSLDEEEYAALKAKADDEGAAALDRYLFAEASYLRGNHDDAWMQTRSLRGEMPGNPYLLILLSRLHGTLGDKAGRRSYAEKAYALAPEDSVVASGWAGALEASGQAGEAEGILREALRVWPGSLDLNLELHRLLLGDGRKEEARAVLARLRAVAPESPRVREALAAAAEREGRFEDWIALRRAMLEEDPESAQARWRLAQAYLQAGRSGLAQALVEEGLLARPEDPTLARALSWVTERTGRPRVPAAEAPTVEALVGGWPPAGDGGTNLIVVDEPGNGWSERLERDLLRDREVAEAIGETTVYRVSADVLPEEMAAEIAERTEGETAPVLAALAADGSLLYAASARVAPEAAAEGLTRARAAASRGEGGGPEWETDLASALERAAEPKRVVVAYLPGEGEWTRRMEETLSDPQTAAALSRTVPVRLAERPEGETLEVRPAIWFLDPEGRVFRRAPGYRQPAVLADDIVKAAEAVEKEEEALASPAWYRSVEYALERARLTGRHVVMDIYTDWCGPCREMERSTFSDADLITTLDSFFVPLKINPEVNEEEGPDWDPRVYPTNFLVNGAGVILKEINDRSPEGYAEALGAEKELALLESIGREAYEERQTRRRMVAEMTSEEMFRSARVEIEALLEESGGEDEELLWILGRVCQELGDGPAAAEAFLASFDVAEEPRSWIVGQILRAEGHEAPEERDARFEGLARSQRGRPLHEAAVLQVWAGDLEGRGERERALELLERSRRLHDSSEVRAALATLELESGHPGRAAERLEPEAEDAGSREMIAAALAAEELGDEDEAARWYEAAREADEYAALQAFWQGRAKEREDGMPRPEGAEEAGETETAERGVVLDARRWYRIAARLAPDEAYVLNQIGYHLAEQEVELDIAVELLRRAVTVSEEEEGAADPNYLDSLAWALHQRGDHEEALEVMKRCLRISGAAAGARPTFCYHLGAIYGALGLNGLACAELQKVALAEEPAEDDESEAAVAWRLLKEYRGGGVRPGS